jgi:hypothetical protein
VMTTIAVMRGLVSATKSARRASEWTAISVMEPEPLLAVSAYKVERRGEKI